MANSLRRIRVELPITTSHGWHLADGVVQQFRVLGQPLPSWALNATKLLYSARPGSNPGVCPFRSRASPP